MLKPTKTFKMAKQWKSLLTTIVDDNERNGVKAAFIQAQLQSEQKPVKEKKSGNGGTLSDLT